MAVTAHFMAHTPSPTGPLLTLQTRLVAFRVLHGSHTGVNIGKAFFRILEEINCLHKVVHSLFSLYSELTTVVDFHGHT